MLGFMTESPLRSKSTSVILQPQRSVSMPKLDGADAERAGQKSSLGAFQAFDEVVERGVERIEALGADEGRDLAVVRLGMRRHGLEEAPAGRRELDDDAALIGGMRAARDE